MRVYKCVLVRYDAFNIFFVLSTISSFPFPVDENVKCVIFVLKLFSPALISTLFHIIPSLFLTSVFTTLTEVHKFHLGVFHMKPNISFL